MADWRAIKPEGPLSRFGIGIVLAVVVIDQLAKGVAVSALPLGDAIPVLPILTLYRVENAGIAFSFFSGSGASLIVLALVVSAAVLFLWVRATEGGRLATAGFALILGGAIGNLIDRLRIGSVVDFLLLHLGDRTLFVFNLADTALTLGPALLILLYAWPAAPIEEKPRD